MMAKKTLMMMPTSACPWVMRIPPKSQLER
jgi:hypothetical protein